MGDDDRDEVEADTEIEEDDEGFIWSGNFPEHVLQQGKRPICMWPPLSRSRFIYQDTHRPFRKWSWILVWMGPMCLAAMGMVLQNFQLRIGTYYYVHEMVQHEAALVVNASYIPPIATGENHVNMTFGATSQEVSFGSLNDPVTGWLGAYQKVDISTLDKLAALFPFLFGSFFFAMDEPFAMTRICVVFFFLAVGKGLFSWITVVPDSNGWARCEERLGASSYSIAWYSEKRTTWDLFWMDPTSRLCADMMYSGHTYFVALFAFGLHEVIRLAFKDAHWRYRIPAESVVACAAILQQGFEIYYVLKSRFHYTSDVVMAVLMTYIMYTNGVISVWVSRWVTPTIEQQKKICDRCEAVANLPNAKKKRNYGRTNRWTSEDILHSKAQVNLGCCCCSWSKQYIYDRSQLVLIMKMINKSNHESVDETIKIVRDSLETVGQPTLINPEELRQQARKKIRSTSFEYSMGTNARMRICNGNGMLNLRSMLPFEATTHADYILDEESFGT